MKNQPYLLWSLVFLALCHCSPNPKSEETTTAAREELLAALEKFNNAFKAGDVQTLDSMITDSYVHTNGTSQAIHKSNWLNYLEKRSERIAKGEVEVLQYGMEDLEFDFHKDFAIITGKVLVQSRISQDTVKNQFRVTHVWIKENGSWKRAGFHDGKIY